MKYEKRVISYPGQKYINHLLLRDNIPYQSQTWIYSTFNGELIAYKSVDYDDQTFIVYEKTNFFDDLHNHYIRIQKKDVPSEYQQSIKNTSLQDHSFLSS